MKKEELTEALRQELLATQTMEEFEAKIGFSMDDFLLIKKGLSQRESQATAHVGSQAPLFSAIPISKDGSAGTKISLADFCNGQQPLALVFGSYTCPVFRKHNSAIQQVYRKYKDKAISFLHMYVYEMHPVDVWFIKDNLQDQVVYDQPLTLLERAAVARDWIQKYQVDMPVALDDMDNSVDKLYAGSPERLYLVDSNGVIKFRSAEGPFADREVEKWETAIEESINH